MNNASDTTGMLKVRGSNNTNGTATQYYRNQHVNQKLHTCSDGVHSLERQKAACQSETAYV